MKIRKKSPWIILFMGLGTVGLMMWGMQTIVEDVAPVTPLIELARDVRGLYSFPEIGATRVPPNGDPAVLRISFRVGKDSRPFATPEAEMTDVAKYARSQFERFHGSWNGITAVEIERTGADGAVTAKTFTLEELAPGARPAGKAWKQVWAADPMTPEAIEKLNRWVIHEGHQPWRLEAFDVARSALSTWLNDSGRVEKLSPEDDHALQENWTHSAAKPESVEWVWKGSFGEFRVTLRRTQSPPREDGIFIAERIEEQVISGSGSRPAGGGK